MKHYFLNAEQCENTLFCEEALDTFVSSAARVAHVIDVCYHEFSGGGYTAVALLSESHASIHTWPELGRVRYDVFTCSDLDPITAVQAIIAYIAPKTYTIEEAIR